MVIAQDFTVETQGHGDTIDITPEVARRVESSGVERGLVTVFVPGSTAAVTTMEYESGLVADMKDAWERLAPRGIPYRHDQRWGDANGYAHLRASLLGPSLTIPVVEGAPALGSWQQVVVIDFDNRPRQRRILVQIIGE